MGCVAGLCGAPAQIAHMHGPDLCAIDPALLKPKGEKKRWQHWLVAPLCERHHWLFDNRPRAFTVRFGGALELLAVVNSRTGIDVIGRARAAITKRSLPVRGYA
jgi:hypothetical protein